MAIFWGVPVPSSSKRSPDYASIYANILPKKVEKKPSKQPNFVQVSRARRFQIGKQKSIYPKLSDLGL